MDLLSFLLWKGGAKGAVKATALDRAFFQALGGDAAQLLTVTGVSPLSLPNAVARKMKSLTQYGKCTVTDGVIKTSSGHYYSADWALPGEYKRLKGIRFNADTYYTITGYHLHGSDEVFFSFYVNRACNVFGCYTTTDAQNNYSLYVTTTSGGKYLRYNGGAYNSYIPPEYIGQVINAQILPSGSYDMPVEDSWDEQEFESSTDLMIGTTSSTATSAKLDGGIRGNFVVNGETPLELIPCERVSDGVIGYYDTYSETFFGPTVGTPVSLGYDYSQYDAYHTKDGSGEVVKIKDANNTTIKTMAFNYPLLAVGDYVDTYDFVSGEYIRKTQICVYDGSQNIGNTFLSSTGTKSEGAIIIYPRSKPNKQQSYSNTITLSDGSNTVEVTANISGIELTAEYYGTGA